MSFAKELNLLFPLWDSLVYNKLMIKLEREIFYMKIIQNQEIINFINKCSINIYSRKLEYSLGSRLEGLELTEKNINLIKEIYDKMGKSNYNLSYNVDKLFDNPYYANIKLSKIHSDRFKYDCCKLYKNHFYTVGFEKPVDSYLSTHIDMAFISQDVTIPMLKEGDDIWMSITPSEINSMSEQIQEAKENVLTFGLGMGYYQYMVALKSTVTSVTIVEKDIEVINLFKEYVLPQFGDLSNKINIIHGDLFDYWNEDFLNTFDYVFVDVWKGPDDGLEIVTKMFNQYLYKGKLGLWIEYTLYYPYRLAMLTYFKVLCGQKQLESIIKLNPSTKLQYEKFENYFKSIDKEIKTAEELKYYLNNNEVFRTILAG